MAQISDKTTYPQKGTLADGDYLPGTADGGNATNTFTLSSIASYVSNKLGLTALFAGKSNTGHTHSASDVTDINTRIDSRLASNVVTTTNDQDIGGRKNFTNLQANGSAVVSQDDLEVTQVIAGRWRSV